MIGFPLAVFYRYLDDQGNYLAAIIAYYAFIAIFPLLLLGTAILGFILQGTRSGRTGLLDSALGAFPIIGDELGRPEGLRPSTTGAVVSGLVALYGALGLGQAIQNALNQAWAIPRNARPNPILLRLRSLVLLRHRRRRAARPLDPLGAAQPDRGVRRVRVVPLADRARHHRAGDHGARAAAAPRRRPYPPDAHRAARCVRDRGDVADPAVDRNRLRHRRHRRGRGHGRDASRSSSV